MSTHPHRSFSLGLVLAWTVATPAQAELPVPCGACGAGVPFVTHGAAGYTTSGTVGTVTQSTDRAILNWQSFNVGTGHRVEFKQPSSTSAALNRIHQADPSRILGAVDANGQVLLVNQNGFVFGKDAKVNTRALTASTLRISDDVFHTLGITGAINADPAGSASSARPALEGTTNSSAQIRVEPGAEITASERVLIIAPEVINEGSITVPDGQAVLAGAKDKVYLAADSDLRGLLVEVDTGGKVTNLGQILTERGNTTLVGLAVNQLGRVRATTSVNVNGTIRLLARDRAQPTAFTPSVGSPRKPAATRSGVLTIGPGSVTEVVPDADAATAVDAQPQPKSRIEAMARTVHVQREATIAAPGGHIAITATSTPNVPLGGADRNTKIVIEPGARIDASGARGAEVPMERNQASIRLFGNELAGSPVQRDGILRGKEITVDLRRGTRIADVSKLYTEVRRDVRERLASGGDVTLASEGAVVLNPGSVIAFGGGEVRTLDGFLDTTRLIRAGVVIDIADASPDVLYDGLYGTLDVIHRKWGVVDTFNLFETGGRRTFHSGYVEGKDGGSLTLTGSVVALNGRLDGAVTRGPWQRKLPGATGGVARPFNERPQGSLLALNRGGDATATNLGFAANADATLYDFDATFGADLRTLLAEDLLAAGGIGRLRVVTAGQVSLPAPLTFDLGPAGLFDLTATGIDIAGTVRSPGGRIRLAAHRDPPTQAALTVAPGARLDVSGTWINEALAPVDAQPALLALDGGQIDLAAEGDLVLAAGSQLDVSAGAVRFRNAAFEFGVPGSITLDSSIPDEPTPTELALGGNLAAFGFERAGSLSITGPAFTIGGAARPGEIALDPARLGPAGFGAVTLNADRGDLRIAAGSHVDLVPAMRELTTSALAAPTGAALADITSDTILPLHREPATSFSATLARAPMIGSAARVVVEPGGRIDVTPGGHIALTSDSDILVEGTLSAPGGDITLTLNTPNTVNERGYRANQSIALGAGAGLDVSGIAVVFTDKTLLRQGEIRSGGQVTMDAQRGFVLGDPSSRIRADGAAGVLDLPSALFPGLSDAVTVPSDGGHIALNAAEGIFFRGALSARAGGEGARGGSLDVRLDPNHRDPGDLVANDPTNVLLTQFPNGRRVVRVRPGSGESFTPGAAIPLTANGIATLDPAAVAVGGFADLVLGAEPVIAFSTVIAPGEVHFADGVNLALPGRLDLDAAVISATGAPSLLRAPQVALGPRNTSLRATAVPVAGDGRLRVEAEHLDLRNHLWFDRLIQAAGIDGLELVSRGDVRATGIRFGSTEPGFTFPGSLNTLANVRIEAARLYPATLSEYAFNLTGANSRLTLAGGTGGATAAPLSVGGALTFQAQDIVQGARVQAPFGSLAFTAGRNLTFASGSVTSVSGVGMETIFGQNEFGTDWLYPLGDKIRVIADTPEKRIAATAPRVTLAAGATLDLGGGGDFRTFEFVPGPGGPRDILMRDNPDGAFAILPGLGSLYGAFDPLETDPARVPTGGTITFAANGAVPAGTYARLAPRYALLPGALLVTPLANTQDFNGLVTGVRPDGATVLAAGRLGDAATGTRAARTSGYVVETGAQVRARAEYNEFLASGFFVEHGAGAPRDAGQLVLNGSQSLRLAGTLAADSTGGRGALVDILGDRLTVTNARRGTPGEVEILASDLAQFRAANVLLGATRTRTGTTAALDVRADMVRIDDDVTLALDELILAATGNVEIGDRARLAATGSPRAGAIGQYEVTGDGAFARVSIDPQVTVNRSGAPGAAGLLAIGDATLAASGSITLESSRDVSFAGRLDSPGSISLAASQFNLGDVAGTPAGLTLTNTQLAALAPAELLLIGANGIDLHGDARVSAARLLFDAPALRGVGAGGQTAMLTASSFDLRNSRGRPLPAAGTGTGALAVIAEEMVLDGGTLALTGFTSSAVTLGDALVVHGDNTLTVAGDLALTVPLVTAATGATLALDVGGSLSTTAGDGLAEPTRVPGLGAKFTVAAADLTLGNAFRLPSGLLSLTARDAGGLTLGAGTMLDLAGRNYLFGTRTAGTPGGRVALHAQLGDVVVADGATLDVAGGPGGGAAGHVAITAPEGTATLSSGSSWRGGGAGFDLAADSLGNPFASLNVLLGAGGFTGARSIALDTGDLAIGAGEVIDAESLALSVNGGSLLIDGSVRVSHGLRLFARDDLRIGAGALLSGAELLDLGTRDGDFAFEAGARIDAGGGDVRIRVPRRGADGIGITTLAGTFERATRIGIEATRTYASAAVDGALIGTVSSDNGTYFANAATLRTTLGITGDPRFVLFAGVEIASAGTLTLATGWDLLNERFDGAAGVLTLRAGGNLVLNGSLSDAFLNTAVDPFTPARDVPQNGPSWAYRLVGGADTGAADPLNTRAEAGDVRIADGRHVRTGTSRIDVAAGRDVRLNAGSALYTIGEIRGTGHLSALDAEVLLRGDFVTAGGDITVRAGRDVTSPAAPPLPDYVPRVAGEFEFYAPGVRYPAAWAIDAAKFAGIGALGGGDVDVVIGGNLEGVTWAIPTNGQPLSEINGDLDVAGGGRLSIRAGGEVRGGTFHVGRGELAIVTDERLTGLASAGNIAPVFQLAESRLDVRARGDVTLETIFNPTIAEQDPAQGLLDFFFFPLPTYFFTYGADSAAGFESLAGNVTLAASGTRIAARYFDRLVDGSAHVTYPGSLTATAFEGDVVLAGNIDLYPAPHSDLRVWAGADISSVGTGSVTQSDADIATLPTSATPTLVFDGTRLRGLLLGHAPIPVHARDDLGAEFITRTGSIGTVSPNDVLVFNVSEEVRILSGIDIVNLGVSVQHSREDAYSEFAAGRDFVYTARRRPDGILQPNNGLVAISGPGLAELIGGRNVEFGSSLGLESRGNLGNAALAERGADLAIWTGFATLPAFEAFADAYFTGAARTAYDAVSAPARRTLVRDAFYAELEASGVEATLSGASFARGERAIATLFPGTDYPGDLRSFLSRITTLDGGDIDLMIPGGLVNAGVASTGSLSKEPSQLGVVVQRDGDIRAYTHGDFLVNASRVFALDGGDILIWSALGNIDAGRGARAALSIPPPVTTFDAQGNVIVEFPAAIAGSGIQAAVSTPGRAPGDVFLFAPNGVVNAGDAGISSAGNLTIAATAVLGADNISVGGVSTGVPSAAVSVPVGLASASNAAGSATRAAKSAASAAAGGEQKTLGQTLANRLVSMIDVQFLGFGE
ncbi:MAG: filamentous hemagglutinin family protein [Gammaproteobacteria bacterium]